MLTLRAVEISLLSVVLSSVSGIWLCKGWCQPAGLYAIGWSWWRRACVSFRTDEDKMSYNEGSQQTNLLAAMSNWCPSHW